MTLIWKDFFIQLPDNFLEKVCHFFNPSWLQNLLKVHDLILTRSSDLRKIAAEKVKWQRTRPTIEKEKE